VGTPTTAQMMGIPSGEAGTRETLKLMSKLVKAEKSALPIRLLALDLVKRNGQKDYTGEVLKIHQFVRDHIRYVRDVRGVETLQTPTKTLELGQGDCDDKSTLTAALLESIGHPTRFIAVGFAPGSFSHVLLETKIGNKWVPVETTEPVKLGWFPPGVTMRMRWHN
jgi:hypothetical protein